MECTHISRLCSIHWKRCSSVETRKLPANRGEDGRMFWALLVIMLFTASQVASYV